MGPLSKLWNILDGAKGAEEDAVQISINDLLHYVEQTVLLLGQSSNAIKLANQIILQLVNQITEAFSQGKYILGIFLDLSKAFDIVNHNILLEKLKAYGIQSENLKWFRSYLSNRKQFILFDDFKTEVKVVKCGVPQGSILGPLLFLIFLNDLRAVLSENVHRASKDI